MRSTDNGKLFAARGKREKGERADTFYRYHERLFFAAPPPLFLFTSAKLLDGNRLVSRLVVVVKEIVIKKKKQREIKTIRNNKIIISQIIEMKRR